MAYKYGIRYCVAFLVCVVFQLVNGWDWLDFVGRCVVTGLVVAASFPLETWFAKLQKK